MKTAAALTAFQCVHAVHQMKRDKTNTSVVDPLIFFFICVHIDGAVTQKRAKGAGGGGINWLNMFTRCNIHGRQRLSCAVSLLQQRRDTGTEGQGTAKINIISG